MASVNLTTVTVVGTITSGHPFEFTVSSAAENDVTITGRNDLGGNSSWFSPNPATILAGQTSVTVTAGSPTTGSNYDTYVVGGMVVSGEAHIQVGSAFPAAPAHAKAS
jgi:hypothetical protein